MEFSTRLKNFVSKLKDPLNLFVGDVHKLVKKVCLKSNNSSGQLLTAPDGSKKSSIGLGYIFLVIPLPFESNVISVSIEL